MKPRERRFFLSARGGGGGDTVTRRSVLTGAGIGLASLAAGPGTSKAAAIDDAIRGLVGEALLEQGRVKLEVPSIVENGNTVPLAVSVDSPMNESDYVESIHLFNEKNPQPFIAAFHIGPRAGKARVLTRIRLADSQRLVAVARMSDGSFWSDSADVIVTLAACTEQ
jgi:sulfur-oxidizing protein SoxY